MLKSLGHPSKKQIRTSKTSVFIVLAGQMKNSQHWRGYQQAPALKKHHSQKHQMNEVKNHVISLSDIHQKSRSGPRKYLFL